MSFLFLFPISHSVFLRYQVYLGRWVGG
jgi:hypothetical protein